MGFARQFLQGIGRCVFQESLHNVAHQSQRQRVVLAGAELRWGEFALFSRGLDGLTQNHTAQTNAPRGVNPNHQQRKHSKRAVHRVVAAQKHLALDVKLLHQAEEEARQHSRHKDGAPTHVDHRDELIHHPQHHTAQSPFQHEQQHRHGRLHEVVLRQIVKEFEHVEPHAAQQKDGEHQKHNQPQIRERKRKKAARGGHAPQCIELRLDIVDERNEGEGQKQKTHPNHHVVLRSSDVGVGKPHQLVDDVVLHIEARTQLPLDVVLQTKTTPQREDECK